MAWKLLTFLSKSHTLLAKAQASQGVDGLDQLEFAYQAALRAAGAVISSRKLPRGLRSASAWVKLAKVAPALSDWCGEFQQMSELRNSVRLGIVAAVVPAQSDTVLAKAVSFVDDVEQELGVLPVAA